MKLLYVRYQKPFISGVKWTVQLFLSLFYRLMISKRSIGSTPLGAKKIM